MLKLRVLSSLILAPLIIWALLGWSTYSFAAFLGVFILVAAWEWSRLAGLVGIAGRGLYATLVGAACAAAVLLPDWVRPILGLAVGFWLWALIEVVSYRDIESGFLGSRIGKLVSGFFLLVPSLAATIALREQAQGQWVVLYLLLLVWGADIGAYFAGHRYGRHKLAPRISPGKTWEGVAGGLLVVLLLSVGVGSLVWHFSPRDLVTLVVLSLSAALVSVLGDLFESRAKRGAGVKDSGTFIPGHGGVLDRIDAYTAAAPLFVLVWLIWRVPAGGA
jgi:phosphatidate cytidylyltransferase